METKNDPDLDLRGILALSYTEVRAFFLKKENYNTINLPSYFNFQTLLNKLSAHIGQEKQIKDIAEKATEDTWQHIAEINYTLLDNKDGLYSWRPLQLIHPAIYICMVNALTDAKTWNVIKQRFKQFQKNKKIRCCSIPFPKRDEKNNEKAEIILNWWQSIEQQSLEFALEYEYMLCSDISDCYPSIHLRTIAHIFDNEDHGKSSTKKKVVHKISHLIQSISYVSNNGIPQASVLMDFIAEIVLGYADLRLSEAIEKIETKGKKTDYQILRYRDDYRIFTKNREDAERIAKLLTQVLMELNLRINSKKTFISNNIIKDSIKPDKLYWIQAKQGGKTLQKHLLLIYLLSQKFPNSGSLMTALSDFHQKIERKKNIRENIAPMMSIVVDIARHNPKVYAHTIMVLSFLLEKMTGDQSEADKKIKLKQVVRDVMAKFEHIPNVGFMLIWLQRMSIGIEEKMSYNETLCKYVVDKKISLWENSWLQKEYRDIIESNDIIDRKQLTQIKKNKRKAIPNKELNIFSKY